MVDLATRYMHVDLRNPVLVGSSGMVSTRAGVRRCEEAGAAGIVLKSLYEDQVTGKTLPDFRSERRLWEGMEPLRFIREAVRTAGIPLFGSLSCAAADAWKRGADQLAKTGVAGIELNVPQKASAVSAGLRYQERCISAVRAVRDAVDLPVAVKLSPYCDQMSRLVGGLAKSGAAAAVFFNRQARFDIDLDSLTIVPADQLAVGSDYHLTLRWVSLFSGRTACDLSASRGIHAPEDALKLLLVGATTVQLCSAVMVHGHGRITEVLQFIIQWIEERGYGAIGDIRGRLSHSKNPNQSEFEELRYIEP